MESSKTNKIVNATKWSVIAEIIAKLILPIINMVLARLLTPEAFGVVATITMIISFAEIFTDAGFQRYLIQHEFDDSRDREEATTIAFWSNMAVSVLLWLFIGIFSDKLSALVGNPGLGSVMTIACASIPLAAFSSIQMAIYKRDLDFKTLFKVRIAGIVVPVVVTVPLAIWLRSYWALIAGTIATNLVNAVVLTLYSKWRPRFYFSWSKLKGMLSFSVWSMIESITIWLTGYIDIFVIGVSLNQFYLGLYKTSMATVGQIISLVTSATTPILFSALSRLQNDEESFRNLFFNFQKIVGIIIVPMGVGIFCFRYLLTDILLGDQWVEAANFIGLWALTSAITVILSHYSSEVYRSLGKPRLSVLAQLLHIVVLCPAMIVAVKYDWNVVFITRSLVRLELILVNLVIMYFVVHISPLQMFRNIAPALISAVVMGCLSAFLVEVNPSVWWQCVVIVISVLIYFAMIVCFKKERQIIVDFVSRLIKK